MSVTIIVNMYVKVTNDQKLGIENGESRVREKNSFREVCSSDIAVTATQNWKWLAVSEMCVAVKLIPIFNLKNNKVIH